MSASGKPTWWSTDHWSTPPAIVAALSAETDTRWFHTLVKDRAEVRFIQGRIKWIGWEGTPIPSPKSPNLLAIYRSRPGT